jgi:integrase
MCGGGGTDTHLSVEVNGFVGGTMASPTDRIRQSGVNHTKESALSDREFQLLLEGTGRMRDYYGFQARFLVLVTGRLGLRAGEVAHLSEDWVDWRRNMICIPSFDECDKGRDGGVCGYCKQQAEQKANHNPDIDVGDAISASWSPKTSAAVREVPFDFDPRVSLAVERFFDEYDRYPCSRQSVNRRVSAAAEHADGLSADDVFPHALRSTAATYHAGRGLDVLPLQSLFGWAQLDTAQRYIKSSGENTARALHMIHSR